MKPQPQSAVSYVEAFIRSTVECEEMNDSGVKGRDMSQIHINNQMNTLRMHNCVRVQNTQSPLLSPQLDWKCARPGHRPQTSAGTWLINNQFSHQCFYGSGPIFRTWPSVCVSLLTCLMLLMGSLIKCAEGVQLKRGIDKQSPWLSAWVNWISTNPPRTGMLSIFSQ